VHNGAAIIGDQVTVNMDGLIDGEIVENSSVRNYVFTLGTGVMLPEFDGLIGAVAGSVKDIAVKLPDDYPMPAVAGKTIDYKVLVLAVSRMYYPDDDELAVSFGGLEAMRKRATKEIAHMADAVVRVKTQKEREAAIVGATGTDDYPDALLLVIGAFEIVASNTDMEAYKRDALSQCPEEQKQVLIESFATPEGNAGIKALLKRKAAEALIGQCVTHKVVLPFDALGVFG
jgi:FKBP-type peptidyl-prolyl cis-trans isomerase (trigger factor)